EISAVDESDSIIDQQNDVNTKSIEEVLEVIAEQSVSDKVIDDFILEESVNIPDSVIAKPPPIHEVYSQLNLSEIEEVVLLPDQVGSLSSESCVASSGFEYSKDGKVPYKQKVEKGLVCKLLEFIRSYESLPNSTASSKQIPVDSDLAPGSIPHLAHLFDKAKKTGQKEKLRWYYYSEEFEKKAITIALGSNISDQMARTQIYDEMELYLSECQKVIDVKNSSHLRDLLAESSEVSISTSPIFSFYVSNSPDNSSGINSKNSPASQMINRFKRTTSCLDLHVSIDRKCLNQVDCYLIHDMQICPICKKDHCYLKGHWLIDSEGSKKYYLICDNIQESRILLNEVLTLYSEKTSLDNWNHLLKVPNREVTVKA
ncbi:7344_t:CDS:2, partial [Funneliformis mosseae]